MLPVTHKSFDHDNKRELRSTLDREAAKYKDTSVTHSTTHSRSAAPAVAGEHIHHHVHEHVQPVIQKEVVAPKVIHTTVPVHETHHAAAEHHGTTVLPAKTLEEFKASGGVLGGQAARKLGAFDRAPKLYNEDHQKEQLHGDRNMHIHSGMEKLSNADNHDNKLANKTDVSIQIPACIESS